MPPPSSPPSMPPLLPVKPLFPTANRCSSPLTAVSLLSVILRVSHGFPGFSWIPGFLRIWKKEKKLGIRRKEKKLGILRKEKKREEDTSGQREKKPLGREEEMPLRRDGDALRRDGRCLCAESVSPWPVLGPVALCCPVSIRSSVILALNI